MAGLTLPRLDEIDGKFEEGRFKARFTDYDGPKPDGYGKPVVEFFFKLASGPNKGETMNIPFVGTKSQRLVDIVTALSGGTYKPGGELDDYLSAMVEVEIENVTKTKGANAGKTFANITKVYALDDDDDEEDRPRRKKAKPESKKRRRPEPEPDYDDEDDDDDYDDDDYDDYDDEDDD